MPRMTAAWLMSTRALGLLLLLLCYSSRPCCSRSVVHDQSLWLLVMLACALRGTRYASAWAAG